MIKTFDLLKKYNFTIQKKYGQNFLVDQNVLEGIADAAGITKADVVLEIGPGLGALTQYLCERARYVIAVEIDRMLIPILRETMKDYHNFTLVNRDILKTDIEQLVRKTMEEAAPDEKLPAGAPAETAECASSQESFQKIKVVANLPYYITTPIVMALLEKETIIDSITVMVQKEVAERMQEGVGTKSYGALSLAVQYYSDPRLVLKVSKNCFVPKPDVDSAVIRLDIYDPGNRPVNAKDPDNMFRIIRAAFNQRRKTLVNSLSNAADLKYTKEQIAQAVAELNKPAAVRGEALTLEEFAKLSDLLCVCAADK